MSTNRATTRRTAAAVLGAAAVFLDAIEHEVQGVSLNHSEPKQTSPLTV